MVEAPGTAPGSATGSKQDIYRHSWLPSTFKYRGWEAGFKEIPAGKPVWRLQSALEDMPKPALKPALVRPIPAL